MRMIDGLLAELEQEAETTRRVLERIPQAHLSWKPHPKSMSLGQLALHVATVPGNVAELAALDTIPEPPAFVQPEAATAAELVPALTASVAKARQAARRLRRCADGRDVAAAERWQRDHGDAAGGVRARDHAEPLVSPSRPAARVSAAARSVRAVGVRSDRRREPVHGGVGGTHMAYDDGLAIRIRNHFKGHTDVTERKMFGGLAFLCNGRMCCGIVGTDVMVRVPKDAYESALAENHVRPMDFTGRPMKGFVVRRSNGSSYVGIAAALVVQR